MRILKFEKASDRRKLEILFDRKPLEAPPGGSSRAAATRRIFGRALTPEEVVARIVEDVRRRGDAALFSWTRRLDGFEASSRTVRVSPGEFRRALRSVPEPVLRALRTAAANVRAFHEAELPRDWRRRRGGVVFGQKWIPLDRAGLYVPGGLAAYPSSVVMNAVPARVAGVREIVMVTPVRRDGRVPPAVLAAAAVSGVDAVYKVGGAQAVAALAFGTSSIPRVDKITGPGNVFVALAKRRVSGEVGIDGFQGPSEVLVLADGTVDPALAAADLLAQAEHDEEAMALLFTTSEAYAAAVARELHWRLSFLDRAKTARASLTSRGALAVFRKDRDLLAAADRFAPEHLEVLCARPRRWAARLRHAGALFLGPHSAEAFGDYTAGPNHVLPTAGTARFASGLSVFDFLKRVNVLEVGARAARRLAGPTEALARAEGLTAHAESARLRAGKHRGSASAPA